METESITVRRMRETFQRWSWCAPAISNCSQLYKCALPRTWIEATVTDELHHKEQSAPCFPGGQKRKKSESELYKT